MPKPDAKEFDEYMAKHAAEIEGGPKVRAAIKPGWLPVKR